MYVNLLLVVLYRILYWNKNVDFNQDTSNSYYLIFHYVQSHCKSFNVTKIEVHVPEFNFIDFVLVWRL